MKRTLTAVAVAAVMGGWSGMASADATGFGLGVKAGTLGFGAEVTKSFTPNWGARVGFNTAKFTTSGNQSHVDYDLGLKWSSAAALLDWYPFAGTFHVTGGYMLNSNEIDMTGKPDPTISNQFNINGTNYALTGLAGKVTFSDGGYLGIGWGNAGDGKGFGMSFELGALYQGSPKLKLTPSGSAALLNDPIFQTNLAAEQKSAEDSMSSYQWYPQVAIGISYAF